MTATAQPESKSPSRRALLTGVLGALGAWAATTVGRASPVRATEGDVVHVGDELSGDSVTKITNATAGEKALEGVATGSGIGVRGQSTSGPGVRGSSTSGNGISGGSASAIGVYGESDSNAGVFGLSTSGWGLYGSATTGYALRAEGRVKFSTAGVGTIAAGNISVTITPGVNVTSGSFVLLTPKVKLSGRDLWFTTNATADTFAIHISSSRSSATKVAWLLLG
jgi:hypothetical protein